MGASGFQLLVVLLLVILLFGTKKLRNLGKDLGSAIRGFRDAAKSGDDDDSKAKDEKKLADNNPVNHSNHSTDTKRSQVIDGEVTKKEQDKI